MPIARRAFSFHPKALEKAMSDYRCCGYCRHRRRIAGGLYGCPKAFEQARDYGIPVVALYKDGERPLLPVSMESKAVCEADFELMDLYDLAREWGWDIALGAHGFDPEVDPFLEYIPEEHWQR